MKKSANQLVWRNTTPIPPGSKARYADDSVRYNKAVARVMKKHKIPTLDLFSPSKKNMKEWMRVAGGCSLLLLPPRLRGTRQTGFPGYPWLS